VRKPQHVSAVADEPPDVLRHGQRVVNKGACSVWQTCDDSTKLTALATFDVTWRKSRKISSEFGPRFQSELPLFS